MKQSGERAHRFRWRIESGQLADLRNLLIFGIVYYLAYKYGMTVSSQSGAPFWFPDPVLICALLLTRPRMWLVYIVATLPLRLMVTKAPGIPLWFLFAVFLNDSLKGLLAAALTREHCAAARSGSIRCRTSGPLDSRRSSWLRPCPRLRGLPRGLRSARISGSHGGNGFSAMPLRTWCVRRFCWPLYAKAETSRA